MMALTKKTFENKKLQKNNWEVFSSIGVWKTQWNFKKERHN